MATYTLFDEIAASHIDPLPPESQRFHVQMIRAGFESLLQADKPTDDDWRLVTGAVNMMEALIQMRVLQDPDGLHADTCAAMEKSMQRHRQEGKPLRLDGPGLTAVKHLLDDYEEVLKVIPHRTMIQAHRRTEKEVERIFGKKTKKRALKGRF